MRSVAVKKGVVYFEVLQRIKFTVECQNLNAQNRENAKIQTYFSKNSVFGQFSMSEIQTSLNQMLAQTVLYIKFFLYLKRSS